MVLFPCNAACISTDVFIFTNFAKGDTTLKYIYAKKAYAIAHEACNKNLKIFHLLTVFIMH